MMLNSLNELHGRKSKCGKFTINIDKGFIAVACNFHDGKDRIVYSENLDNIDNILYDLHKVWNFPLYRLIKENNDSDKKVGIVLLYDDKGNKIAFYDKNDRTMGFTSTPWLELFYRFENWDLFIKSIINCGGKKVEL
ncbi:MAG: hypothetical protein ACRC1T_04840 [Clostridium chrysemydis]|uniref:hypothetical protein n=1 Tax=Clostridium chrysemydis TaxID=2665504 RepID=UPI003F31928E